MARTYRATPYRHTCPHGTCDWCGDNRTLATRKVAAAAADEVANDTPAGVVEEYRAEYAQECAMPVWADSGLRAQAEADEEEERRIWAEYWDDVDDYDESDPMPGCDCSACERARERDAEATEDWAKSQEVEWAYEQRDRELAAEREFLLDWAAFEMERGHAWD
jgi:hypothetical protein